MADAPKEPEPEESEETLLPSLMCLYCSEAQVYVRLFRWNAGDHLVRLGPV